MGTWNTTANGYTTLKSLMTAYNQAKKSGKFDHGRLNRGLGIAMRARTTVYTTNVQNGLLQFMTPGHEKDAQVYAVNHCTCADHKTHRWCKHRISAMLLERAREFDQKQKEHPDMNEAAASPEK